MEPFEGIRFCCWPLFQVYWAGENPKFPEGGKMTQHLAAMKVRASAAQQRHMELKQQRK
jgi:hypothetical protein